MPRVKYIKTANKTIIVFGELHQHSDFKRFNPISAGFIHFHAEDNGNLTCECYGDSVSLKLESQKEDSALAKRQILGYPY